jgi:lysyl-tRNA synthetase class 1
MREERQPDEHWADRVARQVVEAGRAPVISTGISPSGEIHIGNMREVLTADALFRALGEIGAQPRFNYVADNFDPLRKVYPFLDGETYEPLIGRPLSEIRCPCGEHDSYSDHFLEPFLEALARLRIKVEVERADQLYKSGRMNPYIIKALEGRQVIADILREQTGKQVNEEWSPFNPLCPSCGKITASRVTGFSSSAESVDYACDCGAGGTLPMAGGGKLVWRVDWPARWMALGVTVEPFGKDHATRGGSYDTGARIVSELFGGEAPFPIPYEWIRLKGGGDMSSSKGNVLSIGSILDVVPPEALRYLVIRERPQKRINFDPGAPLLQLVDEVEGLGSSPADERSLALSLTEAYRPLGVPFRHLAYVIQAAGFDEQRSVEIMHRTGYPDFRQDALTDKIRYARNWLDSFAPEADRFTVRPDLPPEALELDGVQKEFLGRLSTMLREGMQGDEMHKLIYALAGEFKDVKPATLFQAIYLALLGKPRGPRAGWFITLLGPGFCAARFREASGGS